MLNYLIQVLEQKEIKYILIKKDKTLVRGLTERHISCAGPWQRTKVLTKAVQQYKPDTLFCFGNYPPANKYSCKIVTYIHNPYLVFPWGKLLLMDKILPLRQLYLRRYVNNSDFYLFQNKYIMEAFLKHYGRNKNITYVVMPFFDDAELSLRREINTSKKEQFIYVSLPHPHKNHHYLLKVWEELLLQGHHPGLLLTIPEVKQYDGLLEEIASINARGGQIKNLGLIAFEEVLKHTAQSEFSIYPSLLETLGLGLIEAAVLECKVLAADLPYTRQVIEPSLYFDPTDISSGVKTVLHALENKDQIRSTRPLISNRIGDLLEILN